MVFSRKQLSDEEIEKAEHRSIIANRIADTVFLIPSVLVTAYYALFTIRAGVCIFKTIIFGICTLVLILSLKKGRKGSVLLSIIFYLFVAFILLGITAFSEGFTSNSKLKYTAQRKYVDSLHNGKSDCFPDKLPDDISEYEIQYVPSLMQGAADFRVRFRTSPQQLEEYEKEYSEQAIYTIPLTNIRSDWMTGVKEVSPKAKVGMENDRTLFIAFDNEFWEGHDEDATVYVTYAVHNFNHPHSSAVIINKKEGMVEFTHFG